MCDICYKQIHVRKQIAIMCNEVEHWVQCAGIRQTQYTHTWTCHLHSESRHTTHTDTTPPSRPWSKPPTYTTHTTATKTQTPVQHSLVPTGLVNPKPNPLIHSTTSPPTPHRVKHIHISHTPPTPSNSEQINHPSLNNIYTKLTSNHIHHHYAPSVTLAYTTHIMTSTAPTYAPHCHPWICGQSPPD